MQPAADASSPQDGYPAVDKQELTRRWPDRRPSDEWGLNEFIARLWRRKALIVTTAAIITLATTIFVSQITPRYSATAKILIGVPRLNIADIEDVLRSPRLRRPEIESEIHVLKSRTLAARVVDKLDLVNEPEFNPRLRPPPPPSLLSALDPRDWIPEDWRTALLGAEPRPRPRRPRRSSSGEPGGLPGPRSGAPSPCASRASRK